MSVENHSEMKPLSARPSSVEQYYEVGGMDPKEVPVDAIRQLAQYCNENELEFTDEQQDAYVVRNAVGQWITMVKPEGFFRICRKTGLWLPGEESIHKIGETTYGVATCYTRYSKTSDNWVKVSAQARFDNFYDRDLTSKEVQKPQVIGDWVVIPDIKLLDVAKVLACRKALGDLVAHHVTFYMKPRNLIHRGVQEAMAAQAGSK